MASPVTCFTTKRIQRIFPVLKQLKTPQHLPISAETLTSSTTKKMDPTITHVTRSGDIHRFTVGVSSWVHFGATAMGPLWVSSHWAARWTCSWHFSDQKNGFDHQQ